VLPLSVPLVESLVGVEGLVSDNVVESDASLDAGLVVDSVLETVRVCVVLPLVMVIVKYSTVLEL
jgi:hypothetical protein